MGESSDEPKTRLESKQGALARLLSSIKFLVEPDLPVEDRRAGGRLECSLATSLVTETGETQECHVLDVSRRGLRIRTDRSLSKGISVALKPPEPYGETHASLMARVMWSRKDEDSRGHLAGLLLPPGTEHEETWLEAYLLSKGFSVGGLQRRKFLRAESELPGRLIRKDNSAVHVMVLNLGLGGALIRSDEELEKMSPFRLHIGPLGNLPELELAGTVLRKTGEIEPYHIHSSRFGPLEARRHDLLKRYITSLLRQNRADKRMKRRKP